MVVMITGDGLPRCCGEMLTPGGFCCYCMGHYDPAELYQFVAYARRFFEEVKDAASVTGYLQQHK